MTSPVRFALVIMGTATCLGPAVIGWGSPAAFFAHPPLIALAIVLLIMATPAFFAGGNLSSGVREARGNRWVIGAFAMLGLLKRLPASLLRSDRLSDYRRRGTREASPTF